MFQKLMAKLGVGAASVDLHLDSDVVRLGEELTGTIHIEGGTVEQRIAELQVEVVMKAYIRNREMTRVVQSIPVMHNFTVQSKPYVQDVPVRFQVPHDLAVSTNLLRYYLRTKLDVVQAVDPIDTDYFKIVPPVTIEKVMFALERLEYRQKADSGKLTPFGQEFLFYPTRPLSVPLRELDIIFLETEEGLRLLAEFDVAHSGITGFIRREKEHRAEILVSKELLAEGKEEELAAFLQEKIALYVADPHAFPYFSMRDFYPQHHGHYGYSGFGMGGMIGGMAAGLLGGMLISEMMEGIGGFGNENGMDVAGADMSDYLEGGDGGFGDGGDFGGGDFGEF